MTIDPYDIRKVTGARLSTISLNIRGLLVMKQVLGTACASKYSMYIPFFAPVFSETRSPCYVPHAHYTTLHASDVERRRRAIMITRTRAKVIRFLYNRPYVSTSAAVRREPSTGRRKDARRSPAAPRMRRVAHNTANLN